ncbi:hypothetical protein JHK87_039186 [Glycine soja]|nr:hypothetical protein JHK87_039186 [Glycine soja]
MGKVFIFGPKAPNIATEIESTTIPLFEDEDRPVWQETFAAVIAIETACEKGWRNLWLECDSMLVVQAFKNENIVSWTLRNRWKNAIIKTRDMNLVVGHIYREGNTCADRTDNVFLVICLDSHCFASPRLGF